MNRDLIPGSPVAESELRAVLSFMHRAPAPATALDVAHGTYLSTLVVVPALDKLTEDGLTQRQPRHGTGPGAWTYQLTGQGRRALQRGA